MEPLGSDEEGYIYWYFYGTRLYKEQGKKKKANTTDSTSNKGARGSRGRGRNSSTPKAGRKRTIKNESREGSSGAATSPAAGPPALSDDTVDWTIVCSTADEWEELIESLRHSRKPDTRRLYNYLNDELLPDILYLIQQKVH